MLHYRLHAKFLVLVLGSLIIFLGVLTYAVVNRETSLLSRKAEEKQHLLAFTIVSNLRNNMMKGTPRSTLELMDSLRGVYGLVRLETLRRDGTTAFGVSNGGIALPQVERAFATGEEISFQEDGDPPLHTILHPLKNERECFACHGRTKPVLGVLLISLSQSDTLQEIEASRQRLTISLAAVIILIGGVLYFAIRRVVLRPLAVLHDGAELIGKGELSQRIQVKTNDEMEDLARSFNIMAGRLEESRADLESRIRERTAELRAALEDREDKARRLYDYGRDMAAISRLSTKIFNSELSRDALLDRFMGGVTLGLGYQKALLCLVDRTQIRLETVRDTGLGELVPFTGDSLLSDAPLVRLVRQGTTTILDEQAAAAQGFRLAGGNGEPQALFIIPLLNHRHFKPCWQITSCIKTDCPAYRDTKTPCWLIADTLCGNPLIASYGNKLAYCMTCQVFPVTGVLIVGVDAHRLSARNRNISVLRILAAEMATALESHRLHETNRQMVRELLELHRVTAAALTDLSLTRALDVFTDSALKFSGIDACSFWMLSADGGVLERKAGGAVDGDSPDDAPARLPVDEGLIARALHEHHMVIDYNVAKNDATPLGRHAVAEGMNSLLAISLRRENAPIGVFCVQKRKALPFQETEIASFMLLANQAAMAINVCLLNEELKAQNRELARSGSLMEGILANMSSGLMLLDREGTVQLVNQTGAAILHYRSEEMVKRRLTELLPEAASFLSPTIGPYQEAEVQRPDGTSVPIGFSNAHYLGASGVREGVIVVFRDLTEIRALQAEVLNKERFAAMGRVVAGVAHEIRNPLFGISSVGQIFERELERPKHRELAGALVSETRRLNQLVEELLIYGRPMKLSLAWCDLGKLWEEVVGMHRDEIESKALRLSSDLAVGHTSAYLDAHQIRQVFLNLLRNAIDATPQDGEIAVRLLLEDRRIIFRISDTGCGIPAQNLDKVFDLFFTTKPKGTGLGLGICRKIIQDHGGEITVDSHERDRLGGRQGTTVIVKLPYRGTSENAHSQG